VPTADPFAPPTPATGPATYRRMIVALMAGGLANFSLMYFVQPLLPLLVDVYGITPAESAHALSITTATITIGLLMAGPLADRFGRVQVMRASLIAAGLLGLACAFASSWAALLVLRGLLGVTLAWFPAAALAYLREETPPGAHGRANAAYIAGTAVGGATGRLLPGPLAALGGWTATATTMSLLTLGAGLALWLLLPPSASFTPHKAELREVLLGTITAPADKVLGWLCLAGFTSMGAFVAVYNAAAFRLQAPPFELGHAAGWVYLAYPIGIAAPSLLRHLSDRDGRGHTTAFGASLLVLGVAVASIPTVATMFGGLGLLTFAFLGVHSLLSGWVVDRAARRNLGNAQASSAYLLTYYLGSTVAGALATWQWQLVGWVGVEMLTVGLSVATLAAVLLASRFDRNPQVRLGQQPTLL
jgi:MFS transporter, YNFM family, putative membrane transport protein